MTKEHPQTSAVNLTENISSIGKWGCLAMCYAYCANDKITGLAFLEKISLAIKNGLLGKDCFVKNAGDFMEWWNKGSGKHYLVEKVNIKTIKDIKEKTPVRFMADGYGGHWVVVENGKIVFNSLDYSVNVAKGKPIEARIIREY